jgi:hypothetical protein
VRCTSWLCLWLQVLAVRWAYDDPNPVAVIGRKRHALDAAEAAAMSVWDALPADEKRARIAMAQQARAQRVSAVAAALPEPLLAASATGGSIADDSFDAWRGFEGRGQQQHTQQTDGQQQHQQEQEQEQEWAADPQAAAAAWEAYYAQQQQQQQQHEQAAQQAAADGPGSWFQGWRQRDKPETFADGAGAEGGKGAGQAAAEETADAGGLGLLAGYGSDSESDAAGEGSSPKQQ